MLKTLDTIIFLRALTNAADCVILIENTLLKRFNRGKR